VTEHFDAIVIGTGQAGPPLAVRLASAGRKTAIIEREHFGGTCVNNGCIPTKTLIASARAAWVARNAASYGVALGGPVSVEMPQVKARKDKVVAQSTHGVESWLRGTPNVTVLEGQARFESAGIVGVGERRLAAPQIFINTGGRPVVPAVEGLIDVDYLTSTTMMDVDFLPEHLIVIGGSYIGLEFAQMYRRFGSQVTVIEMAPRLIAREDEAVSQAVREILEAEGIGVRLNAQCIAAQKRPGGVAVQVSCEQEPRTIVGSHLLLAAGRAPNTDDLGLDRAGVVTDTSGFIVVDDQLATSVPGIFALGDVNGRGAFTHTAYNDYEIVASNLLDNERRRVSDRFPVYALFTDPPLAHVGLSEREAERQGVKTRVARLPMSAVLRAQATGEKDGLMKVLVGESDDRILGFTMIGAAAGEVMAVVQTAMLGDLPYTRLRDAVLAHPTFAEGLGFLFSNVPPRHAE